MKLLQPVQRSEVECSPSKRNLPDNATSGDLLTTIMPWKIQWQMKVHKVLFSELEFGLILFAIFSCKWLPVSFKLLNPRPPPKVDSDLRVSVFQLPSWAATHLFSQRKWDDNWDPTFDTNKSLAASLFVPGLFFSIVGKSFVSDSDPTVRICWFVLPWRFHIAHDLGD